MGSKPTGFIHSIGTRRKKFKVIVNGGVGITLAATRQTKKLAMLLVGMVRNQLQNQKK